MTNSTIDVHKAFMASILADDEQWKTLIHKDIYLKGPLAEVQGEEDFITLNEPYFAAVQKMETKQLLVEGDIIATQVTTTIKKHDGSTISFDVSEWFKITEGKIKSLQVYFDPKPLM